MAGWAGAAQGFAQGISQGMNIGNQFQARDLAERKEKLEEYQTLTKTMEAARKDPAAIPVLQEVLTGLKVPEDKQKIWIQQLKTGNDETVNRFITSLREYGIEDNPLPVREILTMSELDKMKWIEGRVALREKTASRNALIEASGGQPTLGQTQAAAAPVQGGAPFPGGAPATVPVAAQGGGVPGTPAPAGAASPPSAAPPGSPPSAGGAAGPPQNLPSNIAQVRTPTGQAIQWDPKQVSDTRVQNTLSTAKRYLDAADILDRQGNGDLAKKYRDQVKAMESSAFVSMTPGQARQMGFEPGTVASVNALTGDIKVHQAGQETFAYLGPEKKKNMGFRDTDIVQISSRGKLNVVREGKPVLMDVSPERIKQMGLTEGTVAQVDPETKQMFILQKGEDRYRRLSEAEAASEGWNMGDIIQENLTTKKQERIGQRDERFRPVTEERRAALAARGFKLDPNAAYEESEKSGKLTRLDSTGKRYEILTPDEVKKAKLDPDFGWQREVGTNEVTVLGTGRTAESASRTAEADVMKKVRETIINEGDAARKKIRSYEVLRDALGEVTTGGPTPEFRMAMGQIATGLGLKELGESIAGNLTAAEVADVELKRITGEAIKEVPGSSSDKELLFAKDKGPAFWKSKKGNRLIMDIAIFGEQIKADKDAFAEEWASKNGGLDRRNEEGKTFRQAWSEISPKGIPDEIRQRIVEMREELPNDKQSIKGWDRPIGDMSAKQIEDIINGKDAAKLTRPQLLRMQTKWRELQQ